MRATITIALGYDHVAFADKVGKARQRAAVLRDRPAHNGAPVDDLSAEAIHVLGARGECAVYRYLSPVKWNHLRENVSGLADLEDWIDVKTRAKNWHSLIVQKDDPAEWAYILADASDHPYYRLVGWCWGYEAKRQEYWSDPVGNRAAYFVKPDNDVLKSVADLIPILRGRQNDL